MKVMFEDLVDSLNDHGFSLVKKNTQYEVSPLDSKIPVYEFDSLKNVLHFHTGVEAQKRLSKTD